MKRKYVILSTIIIAEIIAINILVGQDILPHSWLTNELIGLAFFTPVVLLLHYLSKDDKKPAFVQKGAKFFKYWIIVWFAAAAILMPIIRLV